MDFDVILPQHKKHFPPTKIHPPFPKMSRPSPKKKAETQVILHSGYEFYLKAAFMENPEVYQQIDRFIKDNRKHDLTRFAERPTVAKYYPNRTYTGEIASFMGAKKRMAEFTSFVFDSTNFTIVGVCTINSRKFYCTLSKRENHTKQYAPKIIKKMAMDRDLYGEHHKLLHKLVLDKPLVVETRTYVTVGFVRRNRMNGMVTTLPTETYYSMDDIP